MALDVKWHKPLAAVIRDDAKINRATMLFAAQDWHRLYNDFIPMRTGQLASNVQYRATDKEATITHKVPYARYQYNGAGFNFSRDAHPLASAHWDEAAKGAGRAQKLANDIQRYIGRG